MESVKITEETKEALVEVIQEILPTIKNTITFDELLNFAMQGD
jgi:hypothetical protein